MPHLEYSSLPARAAKVLETFFPDEEYTAERQAAFRDVTPREPDAEGDVEVLEGVEFTHHFVNAPGDQRTVRFHYVEAGNPSGQTIVFLHGIPDSWFQWHHQMAAFSEDYHCIAFDLKGYGQSEKGAGDYRHKAAARQLMGALDLIGVDTFVLVTHDRGTVQGDYIVAEHPSRVLKYARGEQHLFHFHPSLAPQGELFAEAPRSGLMNDPVNFVMFVYSWVATHRLPDNEMRRVIQEFAYEGVNRAVPRYFNSSTFTQEWTERRRRLLGAWLCPVLLVQGFDSKTQPHEFYEDPEKYIPNSPSVSVRYVQAGHFWSMESPVETTKVLQEFIRADTE